MAAPKIIPISDLRQDATNIVKAVTASGQPVFITQRGRAAAVMVSMQGYEQMQRELEMLRLLAKGDKEIDAGAGVDMDDVFAEADAMLTEGKR